MSLTALTLIEPNLASSVSTLSVDSSVLYFNILGDSNTLSVTISVNDTEVTLTNPTVYSGNQHQFTGSIGLTQSSALQTVTIVGSNQASTSVVVLPVITTPTIQFNLLFNVSGLGTTIAPPTGVTVYKGLSTCRVEWAIPTYQYFQGVRVQWSTDSSGVNTAYQQYGGIRNIVERTATVGVNTPTTTTALSPLPTPLDNLPASNSVVTTSQVVVTVNYDHVDIPFSTVNADIFYVILTALIQDPVTNQVYESAAAGPFTCGFVNLKVVNPTDFLALQRPADIATRLISAVTQSRPDLDLTSRAEIRDVIINPIANELANASVREWFSRCAVSISAIAQIDDSNGDGISDPFSTSTVKQQIARAYGLTATTTQPFIDKRFDILGEQAGITRGAAQNATVYLTLYTYSLPNSVITIQSGTTCSTVPTVSNTAATSFITTGSAHIDPTNASAYYDNVNGWWGVKVPAQAVVAGSAGNVGAGTITQISAGGPQGVAVTNLQGAINGTDEQSNADYAAMIQNRLVAGKDSGTRIGYWIESMETPGIIDTLVVAAGDTEMVRDWSSVINRHTFGAVDIYVRGLTNSQQTENVPLYFYTDSTYGSYPTYWAATFSNTQKYGFSLTGFSVGNPLYTVIEMVTVSAGRTLWLGTQHAQIDNVNGIIYIDPTENVYVVNSDGTQSIWQINGVNATNAQVLNTSNPNLAKYYVMATYQTGLSHVPALQPIFSIDSVSGPLTGTVSSSQVELFYSEDFLLLGGSALANDTVSVSGTATTLTTKTITLATATVQIDTDMAITVDANGNAGNILSLRSADLSTVYVFGEDYNILPTGKYRTYSVNILTDVTTNMPRIPLGTTQVVASYYKYTIRETVTLQTENQTLSGTTPTPLSNLGFIHNTWDAPSHGQTTLLYDTTLINAGVKASARYIKVVNNTTGALMLEGRDFLLTVTSDTAQASLTRITGGGIADGASVLVTYYTNEVLTVDTEYPAYVEQLTTNLAVTKHAGADTLVKAMTPSAVNTSLNVILNSATSPTSIDGTLRTVIGQAITNSNTSAYQSQIVKALMSVAGVTAVELPLLQFAKADGSYVIAQVVPTGTPWSLLASDPAFIGQQVAANMYISTNVLLTDNTIPSGGTPNAYVGLLYESVPYTRCLSIQEFLNSTAPAFYIIGANDSINATNPLAANYYGRVLISSPSANNAIIDPTSRFYFLTYQVYGAASHDEIVTASCEYLTQGSTTINYITSE